MSTELTLTYNGPQPTEEEAAAILAAIVAAAPAAEASEPVFRRVRWHESGKLVIQGLAPARVTQPPRWGTIARQRRWLHGGIYGITGL